MKLDRYRGIPKKRMVCIRLLVLIVTAMLFGSAAGAEEPPSDNPAAVTDDQIQIVADKLITHPAENSAEFSGNVRASQGAFVINADRLRIYYRAAPDPAAQSTAGPKSVQQIIATGNVKLSTDQFKAETDRAEYNLETQVLVLVGERSALESNRNMLTGSKIIVDRKTGQMSVRSDSPERVKAVFYPNETEKKKE